jgi:hypothetical protein
VPQSASPWAILLCRFSDSNVEPFTRNYYENLFTNAGTGLRNMVDFFRDYSHGHIDIGGSEVFGWLTIPHPKSDYTGSGANPAGRSQLTGWVRQAASDAGIDLTRFYGVVGCMNVPTDLFGGKDRNVITPSGNIPNDMSPSMLAQEMLHGYGADHSRLEGGADYTDKWDAMSTASQFSTIGDPFHSIGPGLNAANMDFLNWLDLQRVWLRSGSYDEQIQLRPHHRRDLPGYLIARLGSFYVEYRTREGWDATIPRDAVLVHRLEASHSYLMRSRDGSFDLAAGQVFEKDSSVRVYRVSVTTIDPSSRTATVRLSSTPKVPLVTVPNVHHLDRTDAGLAIRNAGLVAQFRATGLPGDTWVSMQSPAAGTEVSKGSTVTCTLQRVPPPPP